MLASMIFLIHQHVVAQENYCEVAPAHFTDYVLAGEYVEDMYGNGAGIDDVIMINANNPSGFVTIDMLANVSHSKYLNKSLSISPPLGFNYHFDNVNGRMIGGDFDNDGDRDDFVLLYRVSSSKMRFDVFIGNGAGGFTRTEMYTQNGYDADKITGRVVSGDFDGDHEWDDIAAFYDYGDGETRIHVWLGTGSSFSYQSSWGWWNSNGYSAEKITNRVVSGDFDKDGFVNDIAAFYDYGDGETRIHVWLGQGTFFDYQSSYGWYVANQYTANNITGRVISVDFMYDEKEYDDIVAFYDVGNGITKMHIFKSTGSSFDFQGSNSAWVGNVYNADKITNKLAAVKTGSGQPVSDIIGLYDYGAYTDKYHLWQGFYDFWNNFYVEYSHHTFCRDKKMASGAQADKEGIQGRKSEFSSINQFPNPAKDEFTYDLADVEVSEIWILNKLGQRVQKHIVEQSNSTVKLNLPAGTYYCVYRNGTDIVDRKKLIIVE